MTQRQERPPSATASVSDADRAGAALEEGGEVSPDLELVTADARRRVFEALGASPSGPKGALDARLLDALARDVVAPRGEVFEGEARDLVALLATEGDGHSLGARLLARAAVEVAREGSEGTVAARAALLRAVAGFLLHHRCTVTAARNGGDPRGR